MPGPCNWKKRRKQQAEKEKAKRMRNLLQEVLNTRQSEPANTNSNDVGEHNTVNTHSPTHPSSHSLEPSPPGDLQNHSESTYIPSAPTPLQRPFIHNPGNGPRVSDMSAYLASFFVPPPALDDLLCATFTARAYDVIGMLEGPLSLPREVALIVWYNKTRKMGRVCPACQRLYRLGDTLSDPITNQPLDPLNPSTPPWVLREQHISGLCSAPCFTLASYTSHPYVAHVVRGAWGRIADEIDEETATILAAPRTSVGVADDQGLGTVLRVTRLVDLGMGDVLGMYGGEDETREAESMTREIGSEFEARRLDEEEDVEPERLSRWGRSGTTEELVSLPST